MNFNLSEDQQAFVEVARQFAEQELAPHAATWDREHHFPKDVLQKAGVARVGLSVRTTGG